MVQGNDWSNVGKLIFKSSIHLLGSGQRLIECWKAHFQEFDSFSWFRATTDRMLESSFSRVRFVFFSRCPEPRKRIELLKMSFPTLDQSLPWTKKTNRTLENELSNIRSVVALNQENESNSWKWVFQHSISPCPEPSKRIELLKTSFPTFDVQGNDWSNVGKLVFKSSIRLLGSGQGLIECWKGRFQEFDSFSWFRATTDRMLESSFSRVRLVYFGSGQRLIECWKAHFQEFDSFSWFRATTDRMLESSFSRVRFVFLVQGNDWSNVGKLIFKSSIRFLGSGQWLIECWKAHFQEFDSFLGSGQGLIECWKARFQEFDSFSWFRATTDRMLESSFSRVRFVFLVQGNDWSNVGKLVFKSLIRFLGSGQRLIECWKAHFQEFDSFSWFRAMTDRMLESSFSRVRFVSCSGQRLIECWKAHFQEFDSFTWFRARTDRMFENSFSRVRFVFLVQGNDWSNVGKLVFKSSIRFLGSGQGLIECWKAHFQEFDSFSWFRARTDRMLESSFSRVRLLYYVQGNDWSNVGKLIFKSSIRFFWFRAMTDRMLESSFSRVRFVFSVQGNDWSNVKKLVFKSSIRLLWFRATTDRMLESSFSRVRFVFLV